MVRNHLTRLAAPTTWKLKRKENRWIAKPSSGPHPVARALTIDLVLKEILKYAKTTKEVKKILNDKAFVVNKVVRYEPTFPVGIMDYIEIPKLNERYQVLFDKYKRLDLVPTKNTDLKLNKIIGKTILKTGKIQVNLHDGRNILLDKFDGKVGDTLIFDLNNQKYTKILKLEKNALVYLTGGKHVGVLGKVTEIVLAKGLEKPKIKLSVGKDEIETAKDYAFVVDKELITI